MFYSSRTLPNFIPFGLCTVALGLLIQRSASPLSTPRRVEPALIMITVLGIMFRSELALFLASHTVFGYARGYLPFRTIVLSGVIGCLVGVLLTVPIDSFFWQQYPLWPELSSFLFNVYQGKSVDWGTSPWYYYFTNAVPKILFNPLIYGLCIPLSVTNSSLRTSVINLLVPNLLYIAIYSLQPHKEWRFIVYATPALTAAGAQGAAWIWRRRGKSATYSLLASSLVLSILASLAASIIFTLISTMNYPGAQALHRLQVLADGTKSSIKVHMDVLTAQTGATLFLQLPKTHLHPNASAWSFGKTDDKTGDGTHLRRPEFWTHFDYALAERPEKCIGAWDIIATIDGLAGVSLLGPGDKDSSPLEPEDGSSSGMFTRATLWGQAPWSPVSSQFWKGWKGFGTFMRRRVTRGWWIDVKMQPMIRILKRIPHDEILARSIA